ncbi:hypothetical protein K435DRAFT_669632 [Dendrothele bispora CBS 962.96]|uniref:Uncharacterized protein n=1 Tax=Dendrothele bispora (strain CBS 962.96) TaxID=1314807 RepID=A0A4S8LVX3_DENBC|nr:hypothetical protein K435DRAFT_669632 [Dendrothele bispora CBS 962.96]
MLAHLPDLLPSDSLVNSTTQVRCFGHVLNIGGKAFISVFIEGVDQEDDNEGSNDKYDNEAGDPLSDLEDDQEDAVGNEAAEARDRDEEERREIELLTNDLEEVKNLTKKDLEVAASAFTKLKKLGHSFRYQEEPRRDLKKECMKNKIKARTPKRAVDTRWNTWSDVVDRAVEIRTPLTQVLSSAKYAQGRKEKTKLAELRPDDDEWDLIEEIKPVLEWFKRATLRISASSRPLLCEVIPLIDTLTDNLLELRKDWTKSPQTRAGAAKAIAVLNKYYSKTDDTIMYKMSMSTCFLVLFL